MNSREKLLAGLIAGIAVIGVSYYGWTKIDAMFLSRNETIANLDKEIKEYELTLYKDKKTSKAMNELKQRSLPPGDPHQRSYDKWLTEMATDSGIEVNDRQPPVLVRRIGGDAYTPYQFNVKGVATAENITKFLYKLYSSHDLHKVRDWRFKPIPDSDKLTVDLTVEAIAIPGAPARHEVGNLPSDQLGGRTVDEFIASIVRRNVFAPANQAPVMTSLGKKTVERGSFLKFDVAEKTSDADKNSKITYALVDGPDGARIDEETGAIRWLAKKDVELGEHTITVSATDSGIPAKTVTGELTVVIKDPPPKVVKKDPPKKPKFDEAKHAQITGVVEKDGEKQLWIHVRTSGKMLKLSKGDEVKVGTVEGTLTEIELKWVEIETAEGPIVIKAGKMLSSGEPKARTALR